MGQFKRAIFRTTLLTILLVFNSSAKAVAFDINVIFNGGLTASQQQVFSDAELFWEELLPSYTSSVSLSALFDGVLDITAAGAPIDGVNGVLGSAGPQIGVNNGGYILATEGAMTFDTADLANLEANGSLYDVILHEMAHVIGFGTLWTFNNLYVNGSGQYTGAAGLAAYQAEYNASAAFVPIELEGGSGTANGHWDEDIFGTGVSTELLTGYLHTPTTFSLTSLYSFEDLGFNVDSTLLTAPVPLPSSLFLMLTGFVLLKRMKRA